MKRKENIFWKSDKQDKKKELSRNSSEPFSFKFFLEM